VEHLRFGLDVRIFFKTFGAVFSQKGVYVAADEAGEDKESRS
jgi:hypothetical protein